MFDWLKITDRAPRSYISVDIHSKYQSLSEATLQQNKGAWHKVIKGLIDIDFAH